MPSAEASSSPPPSDDSSTSAPFLASGRPSDAPPMDRVVSDVPIPPFEPLHRDECYLDIVSLSSPSSSPPHDSKNNHDDDDAAATSSNNNNSIIINALGSELWPYTPTASVRELVDRTPPEVRPHKHRLPDAERIRDHFRDGGTLSIDDALWIINLAAAVFSDEPNVLEVKSPVTVCGDIHGQYFDLMTLFELGGNPTGSQYLFMGDYVDRGCYSTEVTLLLLSYKLMNPGQFWLLRGNHECRHLTAYFNFKTECLKKYNETVYDAFMACFDALPLACRIDGKFLCVHGGIGPDIKSVEDISLIQRFCEPPPRGPMCDILWADPMEPDEEATAPAARYLYNDIRSCSYSFSYKATLEFLKANNLLSLIRAHESQFEGYRMFQKVPETGMPSVICVFSAPNYCEYNNKAAIMMLEDHTMRIRQFGAVEHPYMLQNFLNAFSWSMPFLTEKMQQVCSEFSGLNVMDYAMMTAAANNASMTSGAGAGGVSNTSITKKSDQSRPLHALLAHGKGSTGELAAEALVAAAIHRRHIAQLRSIYLLPRFLRQRGRIILIKVKFCVWLLRFNERKKELQEQKKKKNDGSSMREASVSSTGAQVAAATPSSANNNSSSSSSSHRTGGVVIPPKKQAS